jgi:hypothetical protein
MAFTTQGIFTPDTKQPISPLESLIAQNKKTIAPKTAGTPANVFAPPVTTEPPENVPPEIVPEAPVTPETGYGGISWMEGSAGESGAPEPPPGITPEVHYISNDPEDPYYWETLGYADDSWAGLPYEMGWWTTDEEGNQVWVRQRDMGSVAEQMHELANVNIPERPGLIDLMGTDAYAGIQDMIDLWNDPNRTQADKDAAIASFEQEMGQPPGWFAEQMNAMYGQMGEGIMGQRGLTDEYQDAYRRETQLELQDMRNDYTRMIEAMSAQGRDVAGFMKMDEIVNELSSFEMKRHVEMLNMDLAMKQAEYDALKDRYQQLFDNKQISAAEFQAALNQNRVNALTGYAQEISTIVQQNQLTLEAYSADLQAVQLHAEIVYKSILADMQVSESMMNEMQSRYEMYMAPYYAELEKWSIEQQISQQKTANVMSGIGVGLQGIAVVALCVATSAVCVEMNRQGYFPKEWLKWDYKFGLLVRQRRPDVYSGYSRLCGWLIPIMRRSKTFVRIVNIFFQPWVRDMANLMGVTRKRNWFGRFINVFGFWLCKKIGKKKGGGYYGYMG